MNYNKIKKDAKQNLKHNYFKNVIIVFICTFLISGGISISSKNILNIDFFKQENIEILNNKNKSNSEIIDELLEKTLEEKEYEEKIASTYTHGILAILINEITATKSVLFSLLDSVNKLLGGNFSVAMIILLGNFIAFIFRVFIFAVLEVGRNRYFLEQRRYLTTNVDRFLYPYKKKKTLKLSLIILIRNIKLLLWGFTIVGWFIKYYEYIMIPYVLAENPNIKAKDAFKLSKELTNGEKFNIFKLDLILICWGIFGLFTFNLTNIFFTNVYKQTLYCEVYMNLRNEKYSLLTHNELLNDELLNIETPIQEMYPEKANKQIKLLNIDVNKSYSLTSYILFFFTFSFVGYVYEVIVFLITNGKFVNRGIMYGPWLPIYGCGGVLIVFLLKRFRKSPFKMFIASCVLCGILEYGTAWFLETFKHIKYWDYTGHFMNLQGRICLECLILFGLGGCCFSYIISPILDNFYNKLRGNLKKILCMILIFAFFIDGSYVVMVKPNSGEGITIEAKVNEKINDYYVV